MTAEQPQPLAPTSKPGSLSRGRFLAFAVGGGLVGYMGMQIGGRTVKGWRYNTVESPRPTFNRETYALTVDGMVERPLSLNWSEVQALPPIQQVSDFRCVEGWGVDDVQWDGIRLQSIIDLAKPTPTAKFVTFHSLLGIYRDSLSLEQASLPDVVLAYTMDGAPLTPDHGSPLRVVMPRMYGYKGAKWLRRIEFRDEQDIGYWEQRGWEVDAWIRK